MNSTDIKGTECIARLLKPTWLADGMIASAAFTLRPRLHETYISVLREGMPTFWQDAMRIVRGKDGTPYASMNVGELIGREDVVGAETVTYTVNEIDNEQTLSHAGIFIVVNGHNVVGGEPFNSFLKQKGVAPDAILIEISESLASMAQENIKILRI